MARSRDDNKREAIKMSAVSLFSTNGYVATSIQDIVAHSGLSVGTMYNYFQNKEELLTSLIEEGWEDFFIIIQEGINIQSQKHPFNYFFNILFDTVVEHIDLASLLINEPLLYPKLEKIGNDLFMFIMEHPVLLPDNLKNAISHEYDKSFFYAAILGTIQTIKLSKQGYLDLDVAKLRRDIKNVFLKIEI